VYNVTNEDISSLRSLLASNGMNPDNYTSEQLTGMIQQAVTLIGDEYVQGYNEVDYDYDYHGSIYLTALYPIITDDVTVTLDDVDVTNKIQSITNDGVIKFSEDLHGLLKITYTNGVDTNVIKQYVLLASMNLLKSTTGGIISSINEGDVSISYDTSSITATSLDGIITTVHNMFGARVSMI